MGIFVQISPFVFWVNFWVIFSEINGKNRANSVFISTSRYQTKQTEPTTHRLTGDRGKIPLFPMLPNSPILLGFLDSVGIMEMKNFHYFRAFQKNEEQNQVRGSLPFFAPETYDIFCFSRRLHLY